MEILSSILLYAYDDISAVDTYTGQHTDGKGSRQYISSLCRLTAISHHIRNVAISLTPLWRTIPSFASVSAHILPSFIQRSGAQPLELHMDAFCPFLIDNIIEDTSTARRVQTLHVYHALVGDNRFPARIIARLGPTLSCLHIAPYNDFSVTSREAPRYDLFPNATPALHALALALPGPLSLPDDPSFPSLAHLRITGSKGNNGINMPTLLRFLSKTPALQTLFLKGLRVEPLEAGGGGFPPGPVHLLKMRILCIDGPQWQPPPGPLYLFQHIHLAPQVIIRLNSIQIRPGNPPPSPSPFPAVNSAHTLEIMESSSHALHFRLQGLQSGLWFHLEELNRFSPQFRTHTVLELLNSTGGSALDTVHTLRVASKRQALDAIPRTSFHRHFLYPTPRHLPSLTTLVFAALDTDLELYTLCELLTLGAGPLDVPFPQLQNLEIQTHSPIQDYNPLAAMLEKRSARGHPVTRLTIRIPFNREIPELPADHDLVKLQERVQEFDVAAVETAPWNPDRDPFWHLENKYWPLWSEEDSGDAMWSVYRFGWGSS